MTTCATDFDRTAAMLGPYGTGKAEVTNVQNGKCSIDSDFFSND
jgi:hypothetical protein